jgi:hypothetical protein
VIDGNPTGWAFLTDLDFILINISGLTGKKRTNFFKNLKKVSCKAKIMTNIKNRNVSKLFQSSRIIHSYD